MSDRYMAVDCGKSETKIAVRVNNTGEMQCDSFQTRVIERFNGNSYDSVVDNSDGCFTVEYDGRQYAVGNNVQEKAGFTTTSNSKSDIIHKIATLTAIATHVNNGDSVRVVIGCPIGLFKNKANRESYLNYILPKGRIDITVNGARKYFSISCSEVLPESAGARYLFEEKFKDRSVGVIDIGGLNVNCCIWDNGKLIPDTCFTDKLGRNVLVEKIKAAIEAKEECEFANYEVERFIAQGYITNSDPVKEEESKGFIESFQKEHIEDIWSTCKRKGWNMEHMNLFFMGGGASMLKNYIKEKNSRSAVPDDTGFINAKGFLIKLCQLYRLTVKK